MLVLGHLAQEAVLCALHCVFRFFFFFFPLLFCDAVVPHGKKLTTIVTYDFLAVLQNAGGAVPETGMLNDVAIYFFIFYLATVGGKYSP